LGTHLGQRRQAIEHPRKSVAYGLQITGGVKSRLPAPSLQHFQIPAHFSIVHPKAKRGSPQRKSSFTLKQIIVHPKVFQLLNDTFLLTVWMPERLTKARLFRTERVPLSFFPHSTYTY
jgi:hypothetical protein